MEQPTPDQVTPDQPPGQPAATNTKMRIIAVVVTAGALLAIATTYVFEPNDTTAQAAVMVSPVASHEATSAVGDGEGQADGAVCMANAKPANMDFTMKDLDGKDVALSSYKGKVVLLNFWATWCGPCKAEIPGFVELQEKYKDQLTIVGFSVDDEADKARTFANEYKMNYPILLGLGREDVQDAYGPIWGIPASFIISKDGKVCRKHLGIAPKNVFEKEIVALM
ncbi:MAG: TlpA disulfide reductase family protein [Vicinamibacterales bacterium]